MYLSEKDGEVQITANLCAIAIRNIKCFPVYLPQKSYGITSACIWTISPAPLWITLALLFNYLHLVHISTNRAFIYVISNLKVENNCFFLEYYATSISYIEQSISTRHRVISSIYLLHGWNILFEMFWWWETLPMPGMFEDTSLRLKKLSSLLRSVRRRSLLGALKMSRYWLIIQLQILRIYSKSFVWNYFFFFKLFPKWFVSLNTCCVHPPRWLYW